MMEINGDLCHTLLSKNMPRKLSFNEKNDFSEWKKEVKEKFYNLLGIGEIERNVCPLNVQIEKEEKKDGYRKIRFVFESEKNSLVPCYLLIPDIGKKKYPVAITLQGHSSGFHNSIGEPKNEEENEYALGRGQFAVQAVRRGFVALAIEQRAMGERMTKRHEFDSLMCSFTTLTAFALGRTVIGERVWDVSKAIDALSQFSECDTDKILITGNSGGGTVSYYAACYDERIKLSIPSCSFCAYEASIMDIYHCACNYIPCIGKWFETEDLSCLIAPRKLTIIAGLEDKIFPIDGVRKSYGTVQKIYEKAGATDNCRLIETPKGHYWCEDIVWDAIGEECEKTGWRKRSS